MAQLAQFNVARLWAPIDAPETAEFAAALDAVNALAEQSPGFVWRHVTDYGTPESAFAYDDEQVIWTMSVWTSIEALRAFVYRTDHNAFLRRRREWFEPHADAAVVMWWVEDGTIPTVHDGIARLERLRAEGPGPAAFTFRTAFDAEGRPITRSAEGVRG
jgi:heme-degrading monooxygenase HmoA